MLRLVTRDIIGEKSFDFRFGEAIIGHRISVAPMAMTGLVLVRDEIPHQRARFGGQLRTRLLIKPLDSPDGIGAQTPVAQIGDWSVRPSRSRTFMRSRCVNTISASAYSVRSASS